MQPGRGTTPKETAIRTEWKILLVLVGAALYAVGRGWILPA